MSKENVGVSKLLNSMKKLIREVNDKEICNRLEILKGVEKEDIPPHIVRSLFDNPLTFDTDQISEPFSQYVKHYVYMVKRDQRILQREATEKENRKKVRAVAKKRSSASKRSK